MYPADLKYSKEHEWARVDDNIATVGITEFAAESLGDVVYVSLPEVGSEVKQLGKFGEIESVKTVSDLFSPVTGKVIEVNSATSDNPEIVNSDTYGGGWLIKVEMSNPSEVDGLMDSAAYEKLVSES